ncbi:prepilin peptidase [Brevundimonas sp.]|uniref:prepilin peptidase n=1 Tax=Brevundimonas sp. TaxID=1871086 RepID=UPI002D46FC4E|nr:prepilin peptidase [Brevundimonas sp.]HYC98457.1 prepilin peptidase [Brevundimonas sp.]
MTTPLLAASLGVTGLVVGSFLGLVSLRLPAGEGVVAGRSRCQGCDRRLGWPDLVPVLSYLALRGRCRTCRSAIPARYPMLELAAAAVGLWAALATATPLEAGLTALLGWQLLLIAAVDLEHLWLPDRLTLPLLATGLVAAAAVEPVTLPDALLGAAAGFAALWLLGVAYRRLRGRDGLGGGDPILFAAGGAWVGWQGLPFVLLIASLAGVSLVVARRLAGSEVASNDRVPFAPLLGIGIWLVWSLQS